MTATIIGGASLSGGEGSVLGLSRRPFMGVLANASTCWVWMSTGRIL
jgi:ribose/xylose/arabinose/galactoside ABC-type transport system permease subunit